MVFDFGHAWAMNHIGATKHTRHLRFQPIWAVIMLPAIKFSTFSAMTLVELTENLLVEKSLANM